MVPFEFAQDRNCFVKAVLCHIAEGGKQFAMLFLRKGGRPFKISELNIRRFIRPAQVGRGRPFGDRRARPHHAGVSPPERLQNAVFLSSKDDCFSNCERSNSARRTPSRGPPHLCSANRLETVQYTVIHQDVNPWAANTSCVRTTDTMSNPFSRRQMGFASSRI